MRSPLSIVRVPIFNLIYSGVPETRPLSFEEMGKLIKITVSTCQMSTLQDFFAGVGVTAFLAVTVLFNDPSAPQCPACPNLTCPGNVPATLQSRDEKANPVTPISAVSSVKAYEDWKKTQTPEQLARQQSLSKPREQLSERRVRIRQPKATDHFDVPKNSAAMELTRRLDTAATKKGGDVDGRNPTGNIGATAGQMAAYAWHASQPGVKTICES